MEQEEDILDDRLYLHGLEPVIGHDWFSVVRASRGGAEEGPDTEGSRCEGFHGLNTRFMFEIDIDESGDSVIVKEIGGEAAAWALLLLMLGASRLVFDPCLNTEKGW